MQTSGHRFCEVCGKIKIRNLVVKLSFRHRDCDLFRDK